jgi:uncharacterized SAM-binding protein YcdF (DUF218 family)
VTRPLARWAGLLALATCATYGAVLAWVYGVSREDQRRPVDAIVVLGAAQYHGRPSPVLRARLDHALALYRASLAPRIVVTGGTHPGDRESEAEVQRRYLRARSVPDSALTALDRGATTEESITAVGRWVRDRGLGPVLLVSDGFHLGRLRLEAGRVALIAYTSPAPSQAIQTGSRREWVYLAFEALKVPVAWLRSAAWAVSKRSSPSN